MSFVSDHFDQPGYKTYSKYRIYFSELPDPKIIVKNFSLFKHSMAQILIQYNFQLISNIFKCFHQSNKVTLSDILVFFRGGSSQIHLIFQVGKLLMLLLVTTNKILSSYYYVPAATQSFDDSTFTKVKPTI